MSDTDKILESKLRKIFDDDNFVLGTFCYIRGKEKRQALIDYMDNNNVSYEDIIKISLNQMN